MNKLAYLGLSAVALCTAFAAAAQFVPESEPMPTSGPRVPENYLAPKPSRPTPYVAPNKAHWKLSEILASHRGKTDWVQPLVRNPQQEADYISLGAGKKTKRKMYADDRIMWIVQDGSMRVSIDGAEPFVATKGFMVSVPFRRFYTIETMGDRPSLRFEVRQTGVAPIYAEGETPDPVAGVTFVKARGTPGPGAIEPAGGTSNPLYVDFLKDIAVGDKPHNAKFVWDDNFTSNILRGKAGPVPAATNLGHFHVDWVEFWFIMEGKIGYQIEGLPYFESEQGDVVTAAKGRWHRAGNSPNTPMSTRIPINPRPPILHNFQPE